MRLVSKSGEALTRFCLFLVIAGSLFSLYGCASVLEKKDSMKADVNVGRDAPVSSVRSEGPVDKAGSATAQDALALESRKERLSYALGMVLGNQFRDQSVEVDLDLYVLGLRDGLSGGRTLLTETEARSAVNMVQRELKRKPPGVATAPTGIEVSFKLDPRLTRGMYMGDRWVSPPTFTQVGEGKEVTVEAIAQGLDGTGKPVKISPEWTPEDPEMVTVTPGQGNEVKITVRREGQCKLKVVSAGISRELLIKAINRGEAIQVEISR
jgi:hypothetical protein